MPIYDVVIIGAGACGLYAARQLAQKGKSVAVLEANEHCGGRITVGNQGGFSIPPETGAEFMHGKLPLTMELLQEAGMEYVAMRGNMYQVIQNEQQKSDEFIKDWNVLMRKLREVDEDMPLAVFLERYLPETDYKDLRKAVLRFAEGYDAADPQRVSTLALKHEWESEEEEEYFPKGGYTLLVQFLVNECEALGCQIFNRKTAKEIHWQAGRATVRCADGQEFEGSQVLVTVSLGVLQSHAESPAHITFIPPLPEKEAAIAQLGFGPVIKLSIEFDEPFWETQGRQLKNLGFVFSDATVPTWWPSPENPLLLSGWISGPTAEAYKSAPESQIIEKAIASLDYIFRIPYTEVENHIVAARVTNWAVNPYFLGAYSYPTVDFEKAVAVITEPVANTLYFAGEALHTGASGGTVEAAFASAMKAVGRIIKK